MAYTSFPGLDVDPLDVVATEALSANKTRVYLNGGHACDVQVPAAEFAGQILGAYASQRQTPPYIALQGGEIYRADLYVGSAATDLKRKPTQVMLRDGRVLKVRSTQQEVLLRQEAWEARALATTMPRRIDLRNLKAQLLRPLAVSVSTAQIAGLNQLRRRSGAAMAVARTAPSTLAARGAGARDAFFRQVGRQLYVVRLGVAGNYLAVKANLAGRREAALNSRIEGLKRKQGAIGQRHEALRAGIDSVKAERRQLDRGGDTLGH